ncbi:MAG: hypothetical protein COT39_00995 [Parcubacteria group bacterium CG08_land_8_20_14_0_20_48_21]|nr:MAG: hypothetical protein COT39_00995 [Parcubacteria group bacterium CG08_land_8_20_14_0_20_48_21]PIW79111.1 MAG: hypothetical protein COZ99_02930 [Parcubacteria group bacterium CG_4_8_14_3_um_filter_48_16]PIY78210.1 MAG: hypothetical protein COY83_01020 [Parcubacteria group bacterium CG_4_10_14_0_8_um_filter_48_154]PIZ78056.1 MAG: hypothetical protein COY03_00475 [bacterium CG_4_10_14_0_2_um_filter_48_144]PJC40094.1 MAG: hypothetical protein CO043_00370 [Parcubacteria group bacterium CG_4_9
MLKNKSIFASVFFSVRVVHRRNTAWSKVAVGGVFLLIAGSMVLQLHAASATSITAQTLLELTNSQRVLAGIAPLVENTILAQAAQQHAADMAQQHYFAHTNPQAKRFSSWIRNAGYPYSRVGENLAMDFLTGEGVVGGWMGSQAHRTNLLDVRYTDMGIAVTQAIVADHTTTLVVQVFGAPLEASLSESYITTTESTPQQMSTVPLTNAATPSTNHEPLFPKLHVVTMLAYLQHTMVNPHDQPHTFPPTTPTATIQNQEGFDRRRKSSVDNDG